MWTSDSPMVLYSGCVELCEKRFEIGLREAAVQKAFPDSEWSLLDKLSL